MSKYILVPIAPDLRIASLEKEFAGFGTHRGARRLLVGEFDAQP
ncbi:hypothetical protein [Nonomuraea dietziae]